MLLRAAAAGEVAFLRNSARALSSGRGAGRGGPPLNLPSARLPTLDASSKPERPKPPPDDGRFADADEEEEDVNMARRYLDKVRGNKQTEEAPLPESSNQSSRQRIERYIHKSNESKSVNNKEANMAQRQPGNKRGTQNQQNSRARDESTRQRIERYLNRDDAAEETLPVLTGHLAEEDQREDQREEQREDQREDQREVARPAAGRGRGAPRRDLLPLEAARFSMLDSARRESAEPRSAGRGKELRGAFARLLQTLPEDEPQPQLERRPRAPRPRSASAAEEPPAYGQPRPRRRGPRRSAEGEDSSLSLQENADYFDGDDADWDADEEEKRQASKHPFGMRISGDLSDQEMTAIYSAVIDCTHILPMRVKKPKGLAGLLDPNPKQETRGFQGLTLADFEPKDPYYRFGCYRKSAVDGLLSTMEANVDLVTRPPHPLETVENWFDRLDLAPNSRMRRNPRFRRVLEELSRPAKYSDEQKEEFCDAMKVVLSQRPDIAGFNSEVEPLTAAKFRREYIDKHFPHAPQIGIRQAYGVDPQ